MDLLSSWTASDAIPSTATRIWNTTY